ncbi:MAG: cyclic nucleotide-binding domain-containing protein [Rhodospirillaceae bacterium]|nr:cyclic nucleotide-binding domain-containing protein [Rhodospirillaceae bacterium]
MLQTAIQSRHIQAPPAAWSARTAPNTVKTAPARSFETQLTVKAGETIFHEGDEALYFYKVLSGAVRLVKAVADGHRQICDFNLPGDLIGFSNAAEHEFTAEAIQDCTLMRYRRKDTNHLIRSDAAFACELQALTAKGLSSAYAHMVRLCHRSAHDRLAWFLLAMSDRAENDDGWIDLPMTRVDIADYLGLAHETVSRAFTQLKKSSAIVEPTLNRIKIDRVALEDKLDAA